MKYPVLSTAFCGCSLQLGTIVIAWIQIVLLVLFVLFLAPVAAMGAVFTSKFNHNSIKQSETYGDVQWKQTGDDFGTHWNTGSKQKSDDEAIAIIFTGVGIGILIFITVVLIIQVTATVLLLVGAHKRRPGFLVLWLVLSVLGLFGSLHSLSPLGIVFTIINLYFIWVVYSFYRELKDNPNPTTESGPREVKLQGDSVPHVPTQSIPDAPPAYSYTQKEF